MFAGARGRQIAGRFTVVAAVPFAYGTAEQRANWRALVAAVESTLRLPDHVARTRRMAEQLYRRSRGMIGSLSQLVRGAAILAIDDGTEKITAELLDLVPVEYAGPTLRQPDPRLTPGRATQLPSDGALPRRLPISVPPAPHEIVASYLARLATLNSHDGDQLWRRIGTPGPTPARRIVNADRLAALTGRPASHLAGALPELRDPVPDWQMFRHAPQIGCPRCDAHHRGGAVLRILAHHRYVCIRHGYSIGPPDVNRPRPSLEYCPEVVAAQHRHLRLVQRYRWAAAYDAVLTALMICAHRWGHPDPTSGEELHQVLWTTRSFILIPKDSELHTFSASKRSPALPRSCHPRDRDRLT